MFGQLTPVDQLIPICLINWPLFISWSLTVWSVDPYLFDKLIIPFLISWSLPVFSVDLYLFDQMILTCVIIWSLSFDLYMFDNLFPYLFDQLILTFIIWSLRMFDPLILTCLISSYPPVLSFDLYMFDQFILTCLISGFLPTLDMLTLMTPVWSLVGQVVRRRLVVGRRRSAACLTWRAMTRN